MKTRIFSMLFLVGLFSQISFAQLCSVLKDVRCGEYHTLCVDDSNNLWACGEGEYAMGLVTLAPFQRFNVLKALTASVTLKMLNLLMQDSCILWWQIPMVIAGHSVMMAQASLVMGQMKEVQVYLSKFMA